MFGVQIQEFNSVYLTVIAVLAILWLSYQWWRKEKRIKSLPKIIVIAVAGFIFYKLVFFTTTMVLFTGNTIKDHFFSEITEAQVIDFKAKKNIASKGILNYPVVRYQDQHGMQREIISDTGFGSSNDIPKLHETVKIVINEKNQQAKLITGLKTMTVIGTLISIVFGLIILAGITEYALSLSLEKVQTVAVFASFYVLIPLLITGAAYFFGKSAWNTYTEDHFSGRFWIYSCISIGCLLFMIGYINIVKEQGGKKKKKKK